MRHGLILAATLAAASPLASFAQSQADNEKLLRFYLEKTALVGQCSELDFEFDTAAIQRRVKTVTNGLVAAGVSDARLRVILEESKAAAQKSTPKIPSLELGDGNHADALAEYEQELKLVQQGCDALLQDKRMAPYMTPIGYQTTPGEKSHFGRASYEAANGDADQMFLLGSMYDLGMKPDPDHKLEFAWYLKAAEHGHIRAAGMTAAGYFVGRGVEKNVVEAFKWAVVCQLSGGSSEYRDNIGSAITAAERQTGRDKALAWLQSRS